MTRSESSVFGWIIGMLVVTFVGIIFLTSTMTGFLPYHEQTKQAAIWANAQVQMTEIVAEKEITIKELEVGTNPIHLLSWVFTIGFIVIVLLIVGLSLVLVFK